MALFAMAVPILPGKTDDWKRFRDELNGRWARDYGESRRRLGIRERAFFQTTPIGDIVIVTLEGEDPLGAFKRFGVGDDTFTKWFVQQVKDIHGLDLTKPPTGPMPELLIDSNRGGISQR